MYPRHISSAQEQVGPPDLITNVLFSALCLTILVGITAAACKGLCAGAVGVGSAGLG